MKYQKRLISIVATFIFSFAVVAEEKEIYKSKDKQGQVEFTDQPNLDAERVTIQNPNIADGIDRQKPSQTRTESQSTRKSAPPTQPAGSTRQYWSDEDKNPKRVHREQQRQMRKYERQEGNQGNTPRPKETRGNGQKKTQHKAAH